jgi:hypothetical protein
MLDGFILNEQNSEMTSLVKISHAAHPFCFNPAYFDVNSIKLSILPSIVIS